MDAQQDDLISRALARIVRMRAAILVAYALLVPAAAWMASRIPSEGAIDRLIVPSDPDYAATRAFQRIFPESQVALLLFESGAGTGAESGDPWSPEAIARIDAAKAALRGVPNVGTFSILYALVVSDERRSPVGLQKAVRAERSSRCLRTGQRHHAYPVLFNDRKVSGPVGAAFQSSHSPGGDTR